MDCYIKELNDLQLKYIRKLLEDKEDPFFVEICAYLEKIHHSHSLNYKYILYTHCYPVPISSRFADGMLTEMKNNNIKISELCNSLDMSNYKSVSRDIKTYMSPATEVPTIFF